METTCYEFVESVIVCLDDDSYKIRLKALCSSWWQKIAEALIPLPYVVAELSQTACGTIFYQFNVYVSTTRRFGLKLDLRQTRALKNGDLDVIRFKEATELKFKIDREDYDQHFVPFLLQSPYVLQIEETSAISDFYVRHALNGPHFEEITMVHSGQTSVDFVIYQIAHSSGLQTLDLSGQWPPEIIPSLQTLLRRNRICVRLPDSPALDLDFLKTVIEHWATNNGELRELMCNAHFKISQFGAFMQRNPYDIYTLKTKDQNSVVSVRNNGATLDVHVAYRSWIQGLKSTK